MSKYTNSFFGVPDDDRNFDLEAAIDAYEWVLKHPEEAPFVVSKMLFDNTSTLMEHYAEPIAKAVDGYVAKRLSEARLGLSRSVSKSATDALAVVEEISKAVAGDPFNRDAEGQFASAEGRGAKRNKGRNKTTIKVKQKINFNDSAEARRVGVDALGAMTGSKGFAEYVMDTGAQAKQATNDFSEKWGSKPVEDRGVNDQTWRRMEASSKLAQDMGGKYLPQNAQFALKVGEWAGNYAPQAEKVIGPTARRSAYRYRGVEKKPDPVFQKDIDTLRISQKGGRAAHEALIYGTPSPNPRGRDASMGMWDDREQSRTITRMKELLPDASLYELNRKAGTIPPSQGIIIDRSGKVVTEAVGYGEDWYLPFNLKNLSKLKGGEYIRTRSYGGLTTEDIYVGLVSGARAVTVVSHSGTYTMEFDDSFRGSRRYNDKAGRMHARYAQLLDAVKSTDVQLADISPSRKDEMRKQAAALSGMNPDDPEVENTLAFRNMRIQERKNPTLSQVDKEAAAVDALNQVLLDSGKYRDFNDYSDQTGITDPFSAASALGAEREVTRAVKAASVINEENLDPLKLNGRGYGKAMQALQQQFPYYVARADYIAPGSGRTDAGYVKPKFIRPAAALDGFYDETITGGGKLHADRTNYQNNSVIGSPAHPRNNVNGEGFGKWDYETEEDSLERQSRPAGERTIERATEEKSPAREKATDDYEREQKNAATMALVRALRANPVYGPTTPLAGKPLDPEDLGKLTSIFGRSEAEIESALDSGDRGFSSQLATELSLIRNQNIIEVESKLWEGYRMGGATSAVPVPPKTIDLIKGIGQRTYDLSNVKAGSGKEIYDNLITAMSSNPTLAGLVPEGVAPVDATWAQVQPGVAAQVEKLRDVEMKFMGYKSGAVTNLPDGWTEEGVRQQAMNLAAFAQAYRLRDAEHPTAEAEAPKAEAPEAGADYAETLKAAAAPHQEKIRSMIGMEAVAKEVDGLVAQAIIAKRREAAGLKTDARPMHLVFTGNPGTGKTTVAETIAPLYADLGLIKENKVTTLTKSDITGPYTNQVEEHTRKALMAGEGGVIIIDEAYTLANDGDGRKAIEEMVPMLSKELSNTVVVLAGYPGRMEEFMSVNEGLDRRFPKTIKFKDYSAGEMREIADVMLMSREYTATKPATVDAIEDAVEQLAKRPNNGNGGGVSNFIDRARDAQEVRLMKVKEPTKAQLAELTAADIKYAMMAMGLTPSPRKRKAA